LQSHQRRLEREQLEPGRKVRRTLRLSRNQVLVLLRKRSKKTPKKSAKTRRFRRPKVDQGLSAHKTFRKLTEVPGRIELGQRGL